MKTLGATVASISAKVVRMLFPLQGNQNKFNTHISPFIKKDTTPPTETE